MVVKHKVTLSYLRMYKGTPVPTKYEIELHVGDTVEAKIKDGGKIIRVVGEIRYMVDTCEFCIITGLPDPTNPFIKFTGGTNSFNLHLIEPPIIVKKWDDES